MGNFPTNFTTCTGPTTIRTKQNHFCGLLVVNDGASATTVCVAHSGSSVPLASIGLAGASKTPIIGPLLFKPGDRWQYFEMPKTGVRCNDGLHLHLGIISGVTATIFHT